MQRDRTEMKTLLEEDVTRRNMSSERLLNEYQLSNDIPFRKNLRKKNDFQVAFRITAKNINNVSYSF